MKGVGVMFKRLLIASDLSSSAFAMVDCLTGLKALGARECLLLTCLTPSQYASVPGGQVDSIYEKNLDVQKKQLESQGFSVDTRCVHGTPDEEVNRIAREEECSVIVVGSFTRSLAGGAIMGGLAYDLIHSAEKPVLMIRLVEDRKTGEIRVQPNGCDFSRHVLFPTDFSPNADEAFEFVKSLVWTGVRKVTLLHVQDQYKIEPFLMDRLAEFNRIDEARLAQMDSALRSLGPVEVEKRLVYGSPAVEILKFLKENTVPLVVMGSQGRGFVHEIFLGSVSHNVARKSTASVLIIPAKR